MNNLIGMQNAVPEVDATRGFLLIAALRRVLVDFCHILSIAQHHFQRGQRTEINWLASLLGVLKHCQPMPVASSTVMVQFAQTSVASQMEPAPLASTSVEYHLEMTVPVQMNAVCQMATADLVTHAMKTIDLSTVDFTGSA